MATVPARGRAAGQDVLAGGGLVFPLLALLKHRFLCVISDFFHPIPDLSKTSKPYERRALSLRRARGSRQRELGAGCGAASRRELC